MPKVQDIDTRHFIDIDLKMPTIVGNGYDQKQKLDKGRQLVPDLHRLFLSKGQYHKFVSRSLPGNLSRDEALRIRKFFDPTDDKARGRPYRILTRIGLVMLCYLFIGSYEPDPGQGPVYK